MEKETEKNQNTEKNSSGLKKIGAVVLALTVAANMVGLADRKASDISMEELKAPYVIEECIDMPPSVDSILQTDDEEKEKKNARISVSSIFCFIASWIAGIVANIFPHIFSAVLTPLGVKILGWILFAIGIVVAITLALKKAFPSIPLKELLTGKKLFIILVCTAIIIAICEIAAFYFSELMLGVKLISLILGLVLIVAAYCKIRNKFAKEAVFLS